MAYSGVAAGQSGREDFGGQNGALLFKAKSDKKGYEISILGTNGRIVIEMDVIGFRSDRR